MNVLFCQIMVLKWLQGKLTRFFLMNFAYVRVWMSLNSLHPLFLDHLWN